jgi:hypothetical protein
VNCVILPIYLKIIRILRAGILDQVIKMQDADIAAFCTIKQIGLKGGWMDRKEKSVKNVYGRC